MVTTGFSTDKVSEYWYEMSLFAVSMRDLSLRITPCCVISCRVTGSLESSYAFKSFCLAVSSHTAASLVGMFVDLK